MLSSDSTTPTKRCTSENQCLHPDGPDLPATLEYFYKNRKGKFGLTPQCKECMKARSANWRAKNRERHRTYSKTYYISHRDEYAEYHRVYLEKHREACNKKSKDWHHANRQRANAKRRALYHSDPDRHKEVLRKCREKSPHVITAIRHRRKARVQALRAEFTGQDWQRALNYFDGVCAICGRPQGLWHKIVPDHWIPIASPACPGTVPTNIVPLCHGVGGCNNSKSDRDALEWLIERFGKRKGKAIFDKIVSYFEWLRRNKA